MRQDRVLDVLRAAVDCGGLTMEEFDAARARLATSPAGEYKVMWFFMGNYCSMGSQPRLIHGDAVSVLDAIDKWVYYTSTKFRTDARFLVIDPSGSTWIGTYAEACSLELTVRAEIPLDEQARLNNIVKESNNV